MIEDAVNSQCMFRNFRVILGKSWPTHYHCAWPSFRALIAARASHFQSHSHPRYQGAYKYAKIAAPLAAFMSQIEGPVNSQRIFRNFRDIVERSRPTNRHSKRPYFQTPISDKDSIGIGLNYDR